MKDRIFEIQQENYDSDHPVRSFDKSAIEIADMVKAFVEWLIIEQEIFMGELSEKYIINDNIYVDGKSLKTIDELFTYWHKNIYKIKDKEI